MPEETSSLGGTSRMGSLSTLREGSMEAIALLEPAPGPGAMFSVSGFSPGLSCPPIMDLHYCEASKALALVLADGSVALCR